MQFNTLTSINTNSSGGANNKGLMHNNSFDYFSCVFVVVVNTKFVVDVFAFFLHTYLGT